MSDTIKVEVWVMTDCVGSKQKRAIEVDKEDWVELSYLEKYEYLQDEVWELIQWGWECK